VALGEVAGDELPALGAEEVGAGHVEEDRQRPERALGSPVEEGSQDEQPDRDRGADGEAGHRAAQVLVVGTGEPKEGDVGGAVEADREREGEGEVAEGLLDAERDDQHRRHRGEDDQADHPGLGVDDAGQPGVADPRPPEHAEDQEALHQARPGLVMRHQRRALGDREDEDEVEEELQRRHPLALAADGAEAMVRFGRALHGAHPCTRRRSVSVAWDGERETGRIGDGSVDGDRQGDGGPARA
jgi:hypothetical protein